MKEITGAKKERNELKLNLHLVFILKIFLKVLCLLIELMTSVVLSVFLLAVSDCLLIFGIEECFLLSLEPTLFSYRTHGLTDICTITKEKFYDLMRIQPNLVLAIAAG